MTDEKSSSRTRRRFLQASLAAPAGLGLTALTTDASANVLGESEDGSTVTVHEHPDPDTLNANEITASAAFLDRHDLSVGDQVRLRRTNTEYAVYTIVAERHEGGQSILRTDEAGRYRLDIEASSWDETAGLGCPVLRQSGTLPADPFEVSVSPTISTPGFREASSPGPSVGNGPEDTDLPPVVIPQNLENQSRAQTMKRSPPTRPGRGELIEDLYDTGGDDVAVIAPHGGHIQPRTSIQAELFTRFLDWWGIGVAGWWLQGYRYGGQSFTRWYVPSNDLSANSLHYLGDIEDREFDYVVSFNGICDEKVRIGGAADRDVRESLAASMNNGRMDVPAVPATDEYDATGEQTLVNRLGADDATSLWIGQPAAAREPGTIENSAWYQLGLALKQFTE